MPAAVESPAARRGYRRRVIFRRTPALKIGVPVSGFFIHLPLSTLDTLLKGAAPENYVAIGSNNGHWAA